jgi:uncharacterized protein YycO
VETYKYDQIRAAIKDGDILLYKGSGFFSDLIKRFTKSEYSHAGVVSWWHNRLMVLEAVGRGVVATPISENISKYHGEVIWCVYRVGIPYDTRISMLYWAQLQLGKEYSEWKLVKFGLKILFKRKLDQDDRWRKSNKLFCSQYVSQMYNVGGLDLKENLSDEFTSPDDIAKSPKIKVCAKLEK